MLTLQHPTPNTAIRKDLYRNSILVDDPTSQQQQIIIASARNLEVLDIELVVQPEEIEADTPLLAQIVALTQYMSIKYTKLRSLKYTMLKDYFEPVLGFMSLQKAIICLIDNLETSLDCFYVRFVKMDAKILQALERNKAKLEDVKIWLDDE